VLIYYTYYALVLNFDRTIIEEVLLYSKDFFHKMNMLNGKDKTMAARTWYSFEAKFNEMLEESSVQV
jgi:hypothetical protein